MRALLISTNQSLSPVPVMPTGACLVAEAAERNGHEVSLLDLMFRRDPTRAVADALRRADYGVIGLSIRNIDNIDMQNTEFYIRDLIPLVSTIRRYSRARLVLGGAALSVMPREIMHALSIDCAVVGEGETAFPALLSALERNEGWEDCPGVASLGRAGFRKNRQARSMNQCAVPSYGRWLNLRPYRSLLAAAGLQTKLGCGFRCIYCTYRSIEGETYRLFDPGGVAESAGQLAVTGVRDIEFVDNVFNHPLDHAVEVCEALIRSGVRARFQSVELNPSSFDDCLVAAMERAGFVGMGITVESASDRVLHRLHKGFTAWDVYRCAEIVRRHDLPCIWIFMLGGPGETRETVRETLAFAEQQIVYGRDAAFFGIGVRIYPGTELESIARKEGVLSVQAQEMLVPFFYVAPGLDVSWIRQQVRQTLNRNMNFMSIDSFSHPLLPAVSKLAFCAGVRPPLWRYAARIRRTLRMIGVEA